MKVCIIYDTKRNSTKEFSNWIKNELEDKNIKVDIYKVDEFNDNFNYDLYIIGTPIYYEKPLKSIYKFIENNKEKLNNKKVALFIVCIAQMFGHTTKKYIEKHYLYPLEKNIDNLIISSAVFKGWIKKINIEERKKVKEWIDELINIWRNDYGGNL
ncbi:flavodoxin domain-containing protein [Marinitoga aeolica]|uniref:Flavodoxin-like domain-containing protein n=1 Tax=Marinitoga aeolica TaxID=2809031 RepID=A0ABY8PPA2_9BACT|nr:flavodoxin domain-containing protein [Marinitoga aeolica]WGS64460.1 hypothetical protein JRV97_08765 [Marinitoga aeolica]